MPRRNDIHRILIIGSGPIIIGQACEFDYSGTQACRALRADGFEVILVNSNPATIMTDPEIADRTYVEPLSIPYLTEIIKKERPDALLSTVGGQTGLNLSIALAEAGVLDEYGVELIGAKIDSIKKAEDRLLFKDAMRKIGLATPTSQLVTDLKGGTDFAERVGYPLILRPSFTMGGSGGGIAYNSEDLEEILTRGLDFSPVGEVLVEESVLGWKEYEMEVIRDQADNCIIVCSIENFDPMGVHTGDSITVAPTQTLSDKEYQMMRDASLACLREIGVDTGGSNVQFAINPKNGQMVVVEMNPRVSRSSALASKATGFPIAKIAAKLAVGYRLDEIKNDITRLTPACFEPTIDYVVTKIPRWQFEKFPGADTTLGTQMKSVGEVMAIGRTFKQSLAKAIRSLETGKSATKEDVFEESLIPAKLITPTPDRLNYILFAFEQGWTVDQVFELTNIDPWFLLQLKEGIDLNTALQLETLETISAVTMRNAKRNGVSDAQMGKWWKVDSLAVREKRKAQGVTAVFNRVDTCAAEFESFTPYMYSSYESECEAAPSDRKKVIILGAGPNRIGQGIEFDYCCCHASFALREFDHESIMVNCNPETVSTDYDTSDRLYFEPLTLEDVLNICDTEKPDGVIVQFGGQTPLNLANGLADAGVPIIGTSPRSIEIAEDRKLFGAMLDKLGIRQTSGGTAVTEDEAVAVANRVTYPVLVRPSFVLGGRGMMLVHNETDLRKYVRDAIDGATGKATHPILVDHFLEDATEVDVDCISDGETVVIGAIMEHIEQAGIHSGDSACVIPPFSLSEKVKAEIADATKAMARELNVIGLMNVQFAVQNETVYVLEVNPRASRTAPFVSKAIGVPLPKLAAKIMAGAKLKDLGFTKEVVPKHYCVKEAVFPFTKFPGTDIVLGPEMKSTGEVMGIDANLGIAYAKAQMAAQPALPLKGNIFLSVSDADKTKVADIAAGFAELGFTLYATSGTAAALEKSKVPVKKLFKLSEGRPNALDMLKNGELALIINTPSGKSAREDEIKIRSTASSTRVPVMTTLRAARASLEGIRSMKASGYSVKPLQEWHKVS